jgi:hypothetical protein
MLGKNKADCFEDIIMVLIARHMIGKNEADCFEDIIMVLTARHMIGRICLACKHYTKQFGAHKI